MLRRLLPIVLTAILGFVLLSGLDFQAPAQRTLKDYFYQEGVGETGSINLVSSIYLGYRAFDTLGETLVLFLAVSGIVSLQGDEK